MIIKNNGFNSADETAISRTDALNAIAFYYNIGDIDIENLLSSLSELNEKDRQNVFDYASELLYQTYEAASDFNNEEA